MAKVKQCLEAGYISGSTADSDSNLHIKDCFFKVYYRLETRNISSRCSAVTGNSFTDCCQNTKKQGSERATAKLGVGAHIEMEGIRFCSCQVLLLSLELSAGVYRVLKRKTSAWNNYSYNEKWRILSRQYL